MEITPVEINAELITLLEAAGLSAADVDSANGSQYFGIYDGGQLIGSIGVELYGDVGLLRSLAVAPGYRDRGLARRLVAFIEGLAADNKVGTLYLLTTTAAGFFKNLGYSIAERSDAPKAIQQTSQFSEMCPASATFMAKVIA